MTYSTPRMIFEWSYLTPISDGPMATSIIIELSLSYYYYYDNYANIKLIQCMKTSIKVLINMHQFHKPLATSIITTKL